MADYTPEQQRVADYITRLTNGLVGAGDDPVGFLMASHARLAELKLMRERMELAPDHPMIKDAIRCCGCGEPFAEGDICTLIVVGPGPDPEQREHCREGRAYDAVSIAAHWACATGEED